MPSHADFMATIIANREDDAPRLAFADFLEDQGDGERAEFIRVQCQMPHEIKPNGFAPHVKGHTTCSCSLCRLRRRQTVLLLKHGDKWARPLWATGAGEKPVLTSCHGDQFTCYSPHERTWRFRRGFVAEVACSWEDWNAHADVITASQPIEKVTLTTSPMFSIPAELVLPGLWHGIEFVLPPLGDVWEVPVTIRITTPPPNTAAVPPQSSPDPAP